MRTDISFLIVFLSFIGLGCLKVGNEYAMTKAYDRQAAALERIADALEGIRK